MEQSYHVIDRKEFYHQQTIRRDTLLSFRFLLWEFCRFQGNYIRETVIKI
jgi:hypothetical protein